MSENAATQAESSNSDQESDPEVSFHPGSSSTFYPHYVHALY